MSEHVLGAAALVAALVGNMPVDAEIVEIVPRDMRCGEPLYPRPQRSRVSRYRAKGRVRPAGSKLARKAASGKL